MPLILLRVIKSSLLQVFQAFLAATGWGYANLSGGSEIIMSRGFINM